MKVLLTAASLLPRYGGPAYSVSRLAVALSAEGIDVSLWAADGSAPTTPLIADRAHPRRLIGDLRGELDGTGRPDVLHDNGIWWGHNHRLAQMAARAAIPRIVSTRGMLEPWARCHKRLKKSMAWWLYQRRDLQKALRHHATAQVEADNLCRLRLDVPICVIPNGVDIPDPTQGSSPGEVCSELQSKHKVALFLGRIYPVKGLPMLVEAWARVRPEGWSLHIAGPDEQGHRREVETAIQSTGLGSVISFLGPVSGEEKRTAFRDANLLVLPSHSESFGMVVAEALAHGVPVLTTNAAPWAAIADRGCGWSVETSIDGLEKGLRVATSLDPLELNAMGAKGRAWVQTEFGWRNVARRFIMTYELMLRDNVA